MVIAPPLLARTTMNRAADAPRPAFTARQGQFLAFIHAYTVVNGRPPAEADMMRFFRLMPPSVHQMILKLEQAGLISRQPGVPRSIVVLLDRSALPPLEPSGAQPVKTSVHQNLCAEVLVFEGIIGMLQTGAVAACRRAPAAAVQ